MHCFASRGAFLKFEFKKSVFDFALAFFHISYGGHTLIFLLKNALMLKRFFNHTISNRMAVFFYRPVFKTHFFDVSISHYMHLNFDLFFDH